MGYRSAILPQSDTFIHLSHKSSHGQYERELGLIVDLGKTSRTRDSDKHGQPINVLRIPNSTVAEVYYTERTFKSTVMESDRRLASANDRYGVERATKLTLSAQAFGYVAVKS